MTKTNKYLFFLGLLTLLNPLWAINPYYCHKAVIINLSCFFIFWLISKHPEWVKPILVVIVLSGVVVSVETLVESTGKTWFFPKYNGINSTLGNSNFLGAYLLFPIFACLALPQFYLLLLGVFLPALYFTGCRASCLGFAVGIAILALRACPKNRLRLSIWGAVSILTVIVGLTVYRPDTLDPESLQYRLKYWQAALEIIEKNPIAGIGFSGYRSAVYEAQGEILRKNPGWMQEYDQKPRRAHSLYLEAVVDGGLIWAVALFGFFGWVLVKKHSMRMLPVWCGVIAVLVDGVFFFPAKIIVTWLYLWVFLGVLNADINQNSTDITN